MRPDPARYDQERNALARARGLDAPYIDGGEDANPEGRRRERLWGRLLVLMILAIVGTSMVLTLVAIALGYAGFGSGT